MYPKPTPMLAEIVLNGCIQRSSEMTELFSRSGWHAANHSLAGHIALVCRSGTEMFLYVTNFGQGTIDVFDHDGAQVNSFRDPTSPHGYAPLDLQLTDGSLFVTFVDRGSFQQDPLAEPEHGIIVEFDPDGVLLDRAEFCTRPRQGAV